MLEREGFELPESEGIIEGIAQELGLDAQKKPVLREEYPGERFFQEEAPSADGRYIVLSCLDQIYNLSLRYTPPGAPLLLTPADVRWLYREFRQAVEEAWDLPEAFPDFSLTHLLGATKRQITHLSELKRFHESDTFDPALRTYGAISYAIEQAIATDCSFDKDTDQVP